MISESTLPTKPPMTPVFNVGFNKEITSFQIDKSTGMEKEVCYKVYVL